MRGRLRAWWSRPEVGQAVSLASSSLAASVPAWLDDPEGERGQKIERALMRYLARMAGRPTPFGLFAGCTVGTVSAVTSLALDGLASYRRHTRLDGDYLTRWTAASRWARASAGSSSAWRTRSAAAPTRSCSMRLT